MAEPILVVVFLRGGADGLSIVSPAGDKDYVAARPATMRVARKGDHAGLALKNPNADVDFRFHDRATGLSELYHLGELALIHAAGLKDATRSHFDAEDRMERAAPKSSATAGGWLGRWLAASKPDGILPALAVGATAPDSLRGGAGVAVADQINALRAAPGHGHSPLIRAHLARMLGSDGLLGEPVRRLLTLSEAIEARVALDKDGNVRPYHASVPYPDDNPLANSLKTVAQTIKLDLGLRVATVDYGGWDTHADQKGQLDTLVGHLSQGLKLFWRDLGQWQERVSVVVMSEFGRRLKANESGGTDHGHGNVMFVLGAKVKGGQMLGPWPGLNNDALDEGADLAITTDYRSVLAEMMAGHMGFSDTKRIFPGFDGPLLGYMS